MSYQQILDGCEPFSLGDGPVGALVTHGYTGSPQSVRGLGEYLADRGIAVEGPRLPGHGTTWQDLNTRKQDEWVEEVETAFDKLSARTDQVFLVALSFGSALSLDLAARRPDDVAGIVTLAGIVFTKDPRRFLAPLIARVAKSLPGVSNDIADPDAREIAYDRLPTRSTLEMLAMCKRARAALPRVKAPALIMHGRNDHTVHPDNATYIYDHIGSEDKDLVWLERSYHVITLDHDRDEVYERTHRFISERAEHAV